jgi:hypothetical protein
LQVAISNDYFNLDQCGQQIAIAFPNKTDTVGIVVDSYDYQGLNCGNNIGEGRIDISVPSC